MTDATTEPLTDVIFRAWRKDGDVIAIFPGIAGDMSASTCSSYMHVGQHSALSIGHLLGHTRPATAAEFAPLKRELESAPYGYRLRIIKRATARHYRERCAQLNHS